MRPPRVALLSLSFALALAGSACGGSSKGAEDAGPKSDGARACESFDTEHEELLNAPTSATVIQKTPAHPPVRDAGLP